MFLSQAMLSSLDLYFFAVLDKIGKKYIGTMSCYISGCVFQANGSQQIYCGCCGCSCVPSMYPIVYQDSKLIAPVFCSAKLKPSGKLRRHTPSFGCILYIFLGIKLFCFSRQKAETFRFSSKLKFVKPHKISTHLAYSDNCYFHVFLSVV